MILSSYALTVLPRLRLLSDVYESGSREQSGRPNAHRDELRHVLEEDEDQEEETG